jgi:hypothetical protein
MKLAAASLLIALASACPHAMAQASEPTGKLPACSALTNAERAKCLDGRPREALPEAAPLRAESGSEATATVDSWILSETTSPVDYSPVVIASATAAGASAGAGMKLLIACRTGNTSLTVIAPSALPAGERYTVSYAVDGGLPTTLAAAALPFGTGMVLGIDVVRFLASLPQQGEIAIGITGHQGRAVEARYSLVGLRRARDRMAVSCKWPIKPEATRK